MRRALLLVWLFAVASSPVLGAMGTIRITTDGRSPAGAFSPDGSKVAYLSLKKRFTPDGRYYFTCRVCVWDGKRSRTITELTGGEPTSGPPTRKTAPFWLFGWLNSGEHLLIDVTGPGKELIRLSDGEHTTVGRYKTWFVMNDNWNLTEADALSLNRALHPTSDDCSGKPLRTGELPPAVPRETKDWHFGRFRQSPADMRHVFYVGFDKHFDGCCCCMERQKSYLGIANLRTGKIRRLTPIGDYHIQSHNVRWSPDGRFISYLVCRIPEEDVADEGYELRLVRPDGASNRLLLNDVFDYRYLSHDRIIARTSPRPRRQERPPLQLVLIDITAGKTRRITSGDFRHELCDVHNNRYLVAERLCVPDVGGVYLQGDLYIIEAR